MLLDQCRVTNTMLVNRGVSSVSVLRDSDFVFFAPLHGVRDVLLPHLIDGGRIGISQLLNRCGVIYAALGEAHLIGFTVLHKLRLMRMTTLVDIDGVSRSILLYVRAIPLAGGKRQLGYGKFIEAADVLSRDSHRSRA